MRNMKVIALAVGFAGASIIGGCMQAQYTEIGPQSHFDYPNGNVKPIGPVKVKVDGHAVWFGAALPTSDDHLKVYNAAVSKVSGANMVIDYVKTVKIYGAGILPLQWNILELEGTAAKMEIGKQELR